MFTMLGWPHDVQAMMLDSKVGCLQHMKRGATYIDHTTSLPSLAKVIAGEAEGAGVLSVDAPVSGGDTGSRDGTLVTMVGGSEEAFDSAKDLLWQYSQDVQRVGGPGAGQHMKAAN